MTNLRIIKVTLLGPTNTKGLRVKLTENTGSFIKTVTIPYNYELICSLDIALEYLAERNINVVSWGDYGNDVFVHSDNRGENYVPLKD